MKKNQHPHPDHDRGLEFDLRTLLSRRGSLGVLAGLGTMAAVSACAPVSDSSVTAGSSGAANTSGTSASSASSSAASSATASATASESSLAAFCSTATPQETAGPYPGDGSNGPDVLLESGVVRSDIRSSFGSSTTTAQGVPLTVTLTLLSASGCTPLPGAALYLWHANRDGQYSMYDSAISNENYLRGVQQADGNGKLSFTTIFPAAYSGRWPHIHFEVYESLSNATESGKIMATSQLALPKDVCDTVYATTGYEQSVKNLAEITLGSDNVFGDDGGIHQLATVAGSVNAGYTAQLNVVI